MDEISQLVVSWALTTWLCFAILRRDERSITPLQRERAWPPSTRLSAVVVFGIVALPIHFARTRRSIGGAALGLLAAVAVGAATNLVEWLISLCFARHR